MHRISSFMLALLIASVASAQEWNLQKGEGKVFASYSFLRYDQIAGPDGTFNETGFVVTDMTVGVSGAYGIGDKWTLYMDLPYKRIEASPYIYLDDMSLPELPAHLQGIPEPEGGVLSAPGNARAGATFALRPEELTVSLTLEANTSTQNYIDGTATGYNSSAVIPGIAWIHGTTRWWSSALVQGEWRTNNYSSVLAGRAEAGLHLTNWLYIAAQPAWRIPLNESDADCDCTLPYTGMYLNEQSFVSLQLKTGVEYRNWGLHLASGNAFYVRNIGLNLALTGGLSYHFAAALSSNE